MINFKNNKTLFFAIGSTIAFFLYINLILGKVSECFALEGKNNSLGLSFYYTLDIVQNFFELRTQEQLLCYDKFLKIWDVFFSAIYTLMYASWIAYFLKNKTILLIIPILAMVFDWSENYTEILMLNNYSLSNSISETLVLLGSVINSLKWIFATLTYSVIIAGIIFNLKNFFTKSNTK